MCVDSIYVYPIKDEGTNSTESSLEISTEYVIGENCNFIHQNPFAYCAESNYDDCRHCRRQGCTIVECGTSERNVKITSLILKPEDSSILSSDKTFNKMYELCLPYTVSPHEKLKRCQAFTGVTNFQSSGQCEYDDLEGYSSFTVLLIGFLFIIVIIFCLTVIYYNVSVSILFNYKS
jgi:hypothetical protein